MYRNRKLVRPFTRILFIFLYIFIITLIDVYSYGVIYQQKIKKENYSNYFWSWVFYESGTDIHPEHADVPRYRFAQRSLEFLGALIIFYYCGFLPFLGILISHYFLSYDLLYYLILNQTYLFTSFQYKIEPSWLQNWYQIGYFLLKPFVPLIFYIVGISGIAIAFLLCIVKPLHFKYMNS